MQRKPPGDNLSIFNAQERFTGDCGKYSEAEERYRTNACAGVGDVGDHAVTERKKLLAVVYFGLDYLPCSCEHDNRTLQCAPNNTLTHITTAM